MEITSFLPARPTPVYSEHHEQGFSTETVRLNLFRLKSTDTRSLIRPILPSEQHLPSKVRTPSLPALVQDAKVMQLRPSAPNFTLLLVFSILSTLPALVLGAAIPPWQPLAVYHYRCSSPRQVVESRDLVSWHPSAICSPGLCCSNLAPSPLCTREACVLVEEELGGEEMGYWKRDGDGGEAYG